MQTNDNELFRGFVVLDASASCVASDTLLLDLAGRLLAAALLAGRSVVEIVQRVVGMQNASPALYR